MMQSMGWYLPLLRNSHYRPTTVPRSSRGLKWYDTMARTTQHSGLHWMDALVQWDGVHLLLQSAVPSRIQKWFSRVIMQSRGVIHSDDLPPAIHDLRRGVGLNKAYQWYSLVSDILNVADRHGPCCVGCADYPARLRSPAEVVDRHGPCCVDCADDPAIAKSQAGIVKISLPSTRSRSGCDSDGQVSNQQEDERSRPRRLSSQSVVAISSQSKKPLAVRRIHPIITVNLGSPN